MFTRFLFKPSLTFTICALLLLPQIATTGTAFAANPASSDAVPPSNLYCLDVTGSTTLYGSVVSEPSPPGTGVQFTILPRVANNCGTTVSSIIVTF